MPPTSSPHQYLVNWFERDILTAADQMEQAGVGRYKFQEKISEQLQKMPLQSWEADRWHRGIKLGLIRKTEYFYRVGVGKTSPLSLFVRNDKGLNVGLRRESITQMATFISLITDYGYPRKMTIFETRKMDIWVGSSKGLSLIYAETKSTEKVLEKLITRLANEFTYEVPNIPEEQECGRVSDDGLMKANHIWRNRPEFFWGVAPTARQAFQVIYGSNGFSLQRVSDVPPYFEMTESSPEI